MVLTATASEQQPRGPAAANTIITVTKFDRCAWCGEPLPMKSGAGRPRIYCRRSHRQRHYEARRLAAAQGLRDDEVLLTRDSLEEWRDKIYILEAAIEDAERDLEGTPSLRDYTEAFQHLYNAALGIRSFRIEPRAMGGQ